MKFILGKKIGMSHIYTKDKAQVPVTVVEAGPCYISQVKTQDRDGYKAVQLAFEKKSNASLSKRGHLKKVGLFNYLREVHVDDTSKYKVNDEIRSDVFSEGDEVNVWGISKGKGFQGVVKRYNFAGDLKTHGRAHSQRKGGSIASKRLSKVEKGKKMPGRMGSDRVVMHGLKVMLVDKEMNLLFIKGALPGKGNTLLEIESI